MKMFLLRHYSFDFEFRLFKIVNKINGLTIYSKKEG